MEITFSLEDIDSAAQELLESTPNKIFCFYGEMGAGKTTLIKALLKQIDGNDSGNSPTFGLVNEYYAKDEKLLAYHFDLYRMQNIEEIYDLGIEMYLNADCYLFIEWPELIETLLPPKYTEVRLISLESGKRKLKF